MDGAQQPALIALGSNLGDRGATLASAVDALRAADGVGVAGVSPVVVTQPVGGPAGQPEFLNAVARVRTRLEPLELLELLLRIERDHHRVRDVRWGPRTLDLDLIEHGDHELRTERLTLPHPRAQERAFVLLPWSLLEPDARLDGRPVAELARAASDCDGIGPERLDLAALGAHAGRQQRGASDAPRQRTAEGDQPA